MLDVVCRCTNARRAARSLTELYDVALAPSGLKVTQISLLWLTRRLGLDCSTLGRNLRVLERAGHVRLGPGRDERTQAAITAEVGAADLEAFGRVLQHLQAPAFGELRS